MSETTPVSSSSSPAGVERETGAAAVSADVKGENWRFIPPQPIREEQVQNAVNFLSHPKVKDSPIVYRRSFLERKGLTKEEIDEAFRRVPDPPSDAKTVPTATATAPVPAAAANVVALPSQTALAPRGTRWSQLVLALGLLSAAGAGAAVVTKNYLYPRFKAWLRYIVLEDESFERTKSRPDMETAKPSAALISATAEMAALARELISSRNEERRYFDTVIKTIEAQTREIKQSLDTLVQLQRQESVPALANGYKARITRDAKTSSGVASELPRPLSAPYVSDADRFPPSSSYNEILAMVERGEKPPNIRDVNDKPPNPNQPPSNALLQPKPKPWENSSANGDIPEPWWRQKNADSKLAENSVKIVEIEDQDATSSGGMFSASAWTEATSSRAWVPPPVPKTVLPGADAAIRNQVPSPPSYERHYGNDTVASTDNGEGTSSSSNSENKNENNITEEAE